MENYKEYSIGECKIKLKNQNTEMIVDLLIRIGIGTSNLILLSNGNWYITNKSDYSVNENNVLNPTLLNDLLPMISQIKQRIGSVSNLMTKEKTNLVAAINEVSSIVTNTRHLKGYIQYMVLTTKELKRLKPTDLDICYCLFDNTFKYYSDATLEWLPLPENWQLLYTIVRTYDELTNLYRNTGLSNILVGVLETNKVYKFETDIYYEVTIPSVQIGDEYIVKFIVDASKVYNGTLIYTPKGWCWLISKEVE